MYPFSAPTTVIRECTGKIWSLEGNLYVAFQLDAAGQVVKRAEHPFRCVTEAKSWLEDEGVAKVTVEQSQAYFEMIGTVEQ